MSPSAGAATNALLDRVGAVTRLDAYVVGLAFLEDGLLAAALANGCVAFLADDRPAEPKMVAVHKGACLCLAAAQDGGTVFTGGDDGRLARIVPSGDVVEVLSVPGRWIEPIALSAAAGLRAVGVGRTVRLLDRDDAPVATFDHPSTVSGLAFDPKGRRLAASHYGGVSVWWAKAGAQQPRQMKWAGSHLGLTWSPDGKYIVTTMQESELHGWRLPEGVDMRMSGYPAKVKSMSWLPKGRYLATSGAESVICWPYHGKGGPMGKAPLDLGRGFGGLVTAVAAHPKHEIVAAGYDDGAVILAFVNGALPALLNRPGEGAVTTVAWSADGQDLALGTETGFVARLRLSDWRAPSS